MGMNIQTNKNMKLVWNSRNQLDIVHAIIT